jgi:hypothetical protein
MYVQQEGTVSTQRLLLDDTTKLINIQTLRPERVQGLYEFTCCVCVCVCFFLSKGSAEWEHSGLQ